MSASLEQGSNCFGLTNIKVLFPVEAVYVFLPTFLFVVFLGVKMGVILTYSPEYFGIRYLICCSFKQGILNKIETSSCSTCSSCSICRTCSIYLTTYCNCNCFTISIHLLTVCHYLGQFTNKHYSNLFQAPR